MKDLINIRNLSIVCLLLTLVSYFLKYSEPAIFFFFVALILAILHIGLDSVEQYKKYRKF